MPHYWSSVHHVGSAPEVLILVQGRSRSRVNFLCDSQGHARFEVCFSILSTAKSGFKPPMTLQDRRIATLRWRCPERSGTRILSLVR